MKRLTIALVIGCLGMIINLSRVADAMVLEKAVLDLKVKEDGEFRQMVTVDTYIKWKWLELDIDQKLTFPETSGDYHSAKFQLEFPRLVAGLGVDIDYQQDPGYQIAEAGVGYSWKPFQGFKVKMDAEAGSKSARGENSEYRNHWDYQQLYLTYNRQDWSFKWRLNRTDKVYPDPVRDYLTLLQYNLMEELSKEITPNLKAGITYEETTREYPYVSGLLNNYWKEEYSVWVNYKQERNKRWKGEYRSIISEKGFDREQESTHLALEYQQWSKKWRCMAKLGFADYHCFTDSVSPDPDETEPDLEIDPKSRTEQKLSVELTRYLGDFSFEWDVFVVDKDYRSGENKQLSGVVLNATWKLAKGKLQLTMAPWGNAQSDRDYYQLKLEYNPKDVID